MELSVLERLMTIGALPAEGNYATLKILRQLKMSLSFTEEEIKKFGIESDMENNQTRWTVDGVTEIAIGEKATDIIVKALKNLNKQGKLRADMMTIYEKFIPDND